MLVPTVAKLVFCVKRRPPRLPVQPKTSVPIASYLARFLVVSTRTDNPSSPYCSTMAQDRPDRGKLFFLPIYICKPWKWNFSLV